MARILVAYYSRSGTTRRVATEIAHALGADLEEIHDQRDRSGVAGYLRSAAEGILEAGSDIERNTHDPRGYDLVILGTPTWFASLSSPARSFIWQHRRDFKDVAFFCTCGGRWGDRVLSQMASAAGKQPRATLVLRQGDVSREKASGAVRGFVDRLQRTVNGGRPRVDPAPAPLPWHGS